MKKLLCILTAICILAITMGSVVMAEETVTATNLARETGVDVTVHSTQWGSMPASKIVDGDTANGWASASAEAAGKWAQVKLVKPAKISEIKIYNNTSASRNWKVSYSIDGVTWTEASYTMTQATTKPYLLEVTDSDFVAQYVKVEYVPSYAGVVVVAEIEIYGEYAKLPFLSSLTADSGELTPAFDMNTTSYKVQVNNFDNLNLNYKEYITGAVANMTQEPTAGNDYTAIITVTHEGETKDYTVQFVEYNWAFATNGATVHENVGGSTSFEASADKAIDGDLNIGFLANPSASERYVTIKLQKPIAIDNIDFYTGNGSKDNYSVWYSLTGEADSYVQGPEKIINDASPFHWTSALNGAVAQYVRVQVDAASYLWVYEIEVYGKAVTETYTTSYTLAENVLTGNVTFFNKTESAENDKYYLMAVYVDDVLYNVIPANKATNSVAAGAVAGTKLISTTLPAGEVTAKVFVWNNPAELVPVTTAPLTLK